MKLPHFFIDRPRFATVVSIVIVLVGSLAYFQLPVAQYPEVALPTVVVRTAYPGATPETIARTVATPLEQEINGVEDMLYMESQSTGDGSMSLTISFKLGADLDKAQVLVQNRVAVAEPRLPEEVRRIGVTTTKSSPDLLLVVHLLSPDNTRDQLYISNYAYLQLRDRLARIDGVGDLRIFGGREYSMRVWLDMERIASLNLTAGDVVAALRSQNIQVAAGVIGQPPLEKDGATQLMVSTKGRLRTPQEFEQIVVKSGENGRLVRVSDVARVELGALDYSVNSYLDGQPAVAMVVFQRPGSNGIDTANRVIEAMGELSEDFPAGLSHEIVYNPTQFVSDSIDEVFVTLLQAGALVVLTVFIFLQNWRSTVVPVVAIPVSLVGTFAALLVLGFSLNMLSLFGLVLAIGIVVDDAIVVVENVERLMEDEGLDPRKATHQAMDEVASALIATTLVLIAVFVPTAFISGISGQFYRQFAVTIAISTAISTLVSLTLSPALCALLLKSKGAKKNWLDQASDKLLGWFFRAFNKVFDVVNKVYGEIICKLLRVSFFALLVYGGLLVLTWFGFSQVPTGFIPPQDQGYLIVAAQLPDGASLSRTDEVVQKVKEIALDTPGIAHAVAFAGFSGATRSNNANAAAVFTPLTAYEDRPEGMDINSILGDLRGRLGKLQEAQVFVIAPPPVRGIGTGGGFKLQVQDRAGGTSRELQQAATNLFMAANKQPGLVQVFSTFRADTPQIYADVDRTKVRMMDVPIGNVFDALQVYLGSTYVNDFNYLGRTYRVTAQAEPEFRDDPSDIAKLRTRSNTGAVVPLGSLVNIRTTTAPDRVVRYNLYPAADVSGDTLPGTSSGDAIATMERLAEEILPPGYDYEWTDLAYQQKAAGNTAIFIFPLCVLFVFLALSAQYESWLLPLAVILIVPMCLLCAIAGVWFRGMDNNILTQIGFVVLVGLACKNAILIVEFAKAEEEKGKNRFEAAIEACRLRLRPILMTALSFVLGVIPLLIATGAGSEMRRALGTAVFSGMLGVTIFGLFFTPIFYVVLRKFAKDNPANTGDVSC